MIRVDQLDNKKPFISLGPGYEYALDKTGEENYNAMKAYYAKKGIHIGNMSPEEKMELDEEIDKMIPHLKRVLQRMDSEGSN